MFTVTMALVGGEVGQPVEHRRKGGLRRGLRIGGAVLRAFPWRGKAVRIEAREQMIGSSCPPDRTENVRGDILTQSYQQAFARHAPLSDQLALMIDLLDPAMDRAVEGERGQAADRELLRMIR